VDLAFTFCSCFELSFYRYTIWLEAFMSNGKKIRSNVIDIVTKAGHLPMPEKSEQGKTLIANGTHVM